MNVNPGLINPRLFNLWGTISVAIYTHLLLFGEPPQLINQGTL